MLLDLFDLIYGITQPTQELTAVRGRPGQIYVEVDGDDTEPICRWLIMNPDGTARDVSDVTSTATLYYRASGFYKTYWKVELTKTNGGGDGLVDYRPSLTEPFLPSGFVISNPSGIYRFHGQLVFEDSVTGETVRFKDALVADVHPVFAEP